MAQDSNTKGGGLEGIEQAIEQAAKHVEQDIERLIEPRRGDGEPPSVVPDEVNLTAFDSKQISFEPPTGALAIRNAFEAVYGNADPTQVFSLVWPGTKFDYGRFHWDEGDLADPNPVYPPVTDIVTSLLLDQWYPPAPITQPDGSSTAQRYRQAIGALAPRPNPSVWSTQAQVREALQEEVYYQPHASDGQLGDGVWMTLSDLFDLLNGQWIAARREWGELQFQQLEALGLVGVDPGDQSKMDEWNSYASWYELVADGYIADINEKYDQLLVYFPLTAWNDALAILDTTDAPYLEEAKQQMREMEFPVPHQFGVSYFPTTADPYDFGNYLIPTTKFIDLLADPQFVGAGLANDLEAFQDQVASLQQTCLFLDDDLQKQVKDANADYAKALDEHRKSVLAMQQAYIDSTVTAAKAFIAYETGGLSLAGGIVGKDGGELDPSKLAGDVEAKLDPDQADDLMTRLCNATAQKYKNVEALETDLTATVWSLTGADNKGGEVDLTKATKVADVTDAIRQECASRAGVRCDTLMPDAKHPKATLNFAVAGSASPKKDDETVAPPSGDATPTIWLAAAASTTIPANGTLPPTTPLVFAKGTAGTDYKTISATKDSTGAVKYAETTATGSSDQLDALVDAVAKNMASINSDQQSVITSGMALAEAAASAAQAENRENVQQMVLPMASQIEQSAANLKQKLTEFNASSAKSAASSAGVSPFPAPLTAPDPSKPGQSMPTDIWDSVQVKVSISAMKAMTQESASGSQSSWGVNLFLVSAGGSESSKASSYMSQAAKANSDIEVGMLCTKVTINRSWMRPEIFEDTSDLYRATEQPVTNAGGPKGGQLTETALFGDIGNGSSLEPGTVPGSFADLVDYSLPSYPVSLLIAKDVTIKVTTNAGATAVARQQQSHTSAAQGGFLCFSADSSSSSSSSSSNQSSFCEADTQVFRLPAPQVIGVWSQLTPADASKQLSKNINDVTDALKVISGIQQAKNVGRARRSGSTSA